MFNIFSRSNISTFFEKFLTYHIYAEHCVIQTKGLGLCFEPQWEACNLQARTASSQGNLDKSRLVQHLVVPGG